MFDKVKLQPEQWLGISIDTLLAEGSLKWKAKGLGCFECETPKLIFLGLDIFSLTANTFELETVRVVSLSFKEINDEFLREIQSNYGEAFHALVETGKRTLVESSPESENRGFTQVLKEEFLEMTKGQLKFGGFNTAYWEFITYRLTLRLYQHEDTWLGTLYYLATNNDDT